MSHPDEMPSCVKCGGSPNEPRFVVRRNTLRERMKSMFFQEWGVHDCDDRSHFMYLVQRAHERTVAR